MIDMTSGFTLTHMPVKQNISIVNLSAEQAAYLVSVLPYYAEDSLESCLTA